MVPISPRPAATQGFCHMLSWPAAAFFLGHHFISQAFSFSIWAPNFKPVKASVEYGWWWVEKDMGRLREECVSVYHSPTGSLQFDFWVCLIFFLCSLLSCQLIDLITHKDAVTFYNTKWHSTKKWNLKKMVGDRHDISCFVSVSFSEIQGMR